MAASAEGSSFILVGAARMALRARRLARRLAAKVKEAESSGTSFEGIPLEGYTHAPLKEYTRSTGRNWIWTSNIDYNAS